MRVSTFKKPFDLSKNRPRLTPQLRTVDIAGVEASSKLTKPGFVSFLTATKKLAAYQN